MGGGSASPGLGAMGGVGDDIKADGATAPDAVSALRGRPASPLHLLSSNLAPQQKRGGLGSVLVAVQGQELAGRWHEAAMKSGKVGMPGRSSPLLVWGHMGPWG